MTNNDLISVLQGYGLDQVLKDQDDPRLWEAALSKHWPHPDDLHPNDPLLRDRRITGTPRFSFGVGHLPVESDGSRNLSGIQIYEQWIFERIDDHHFKAMRADPENRFIYPHFILDISRPSTGTNIAWVHAGSNPVPLVGEGVTVVWARQEDGSWIETQELVDMWIS